VVGTLPAALALLFVDEVERLQRSVTATAILLLVTGAVMLLAERVRPGQRSIPDARPGDALLIGFAQLLAILPGISRSGMTISTALGRGFSRLEAARFSFLLGVPAITAAGLLELFTLNERGGVPASAWVGVVVAAITGYLAIAFLLRMLARTGLFAYAIYCLVVGTLALLIL
jgi:undecaprenyl-diphosphatase